MTFSAITTIFFLLVLKFYLGDLKVFHIKEFENLLCNEFGNIFYSEILKSFKKIVF